MNLKRIINKMFRMKGFFLNRAYRLKIYSLMFFMAIINIIYNLVMLLLLFATIIPLVVWKNKDFEKISDWIHQLMPTIPEIEKEN